MVVSPTVVSVRSLRPRVTFNARASSTTRSLPWARVGGPIRFAQRISGVSSGTASRETRQNGRKTRLSATQCAVSASLQRDNRLTAIIRRITSTGVECRPCVRVWGVSAGKVRLHRGEHDIIVEETIQLGENWIHLQIELRNQGEKIHRFVAVTQHGQFPPVGLPYHDTTTPNPAISHRKRVLVLPRSSGLVRGQHALSEKRPFQSKCGAIRT